MTKTFAINPRSILGLSENVARLFCASENVRERRRSCLIVEATLLTMLARLLAAPDVWRPLPPTRWACLFSMMNSYFLCFEMLMRHRAAPFGCDGPSSLRFSLPW